MPPAAWWPVRRPLWGGRNCGRGSARRCAPCAPFLPFPLPRPTSPSGGAPASGGKTIRRGGRGPWGGGPELEVLEWREEDVDMGRRWWAWRPLGERERRWQELGWRTCTGGGGIGKLGGAHGGMGTGTWDGGGVLGGAWWSGSGGAGGWGWRTRTGSAENGTHGAARGGRGMWTWGGGGVRGGARGGGSGGSGALGGRGGTLGSGGGASERLRRGGAVGSVSAGPGCAVRGGGGSAAVCGTGPCRGARLAIEEVSAGPGGPRLVLPGTRGGGGGSPPPSIDPPRRGAAAAAAGGTGPVTVPGGVGPGGAPSACTWWPGGYGSWYGGGGP